MKKTSQLNIEELESDKDLLNKEIKYCRNRLKSLLFSDGSDNEYFINNYKKSLRFKIEEKKYLNRLLKKLNNY